MGLFRNDESSVESETSPESSSNPLRDDWANRNNISFQDSPDSAYDEEATTPATTPAVRPPVAPATPTYVPSENGSSYRIQSGDTLSGIVNDYNAQNGTNYTVDEIAQQNGITDPNKIYVGQSVNFGTAQTTPAQTTPAQSAPAQSAPAQTTVPQIEPVQTTAMPGNAIDLSGFNQFFQQSQSNSSAAPANIQSDLTGISDRLANRLDKYNRINRYGNFIKARQEEHPESRYLNRMERRADRRENRAYNRLSRLAARQGVDFGTNQDESAYINPAVQSQNQAAPTVKPATPTYAGRYGQTIDPWTGKVSYKI